MELDIPRLNDMLGVSNGPSSWAEDGDPSKLVHADGRFVPVASGVADELERLMREGQNMPEDAKLCWGCILTILKGVVFEMVQRHPYSGAEPSELITTLGDDIYQSGRALRRAALLEHGGDQFEALAFIRGIEDRRNQERAS